MIFITNYLLNQEKPQKPRKANDIYSSWLFLDLFIVFDSLYLVIQNIGGSI